MHAHARTAVVVSKVHHADDIVEPMGFVPTMTAGATLTGKGEGIVDWEALTLE